MDKNSMIIKQNHLVFAIIILVGFILFQGASSGNKATEPTQTGTELSDVYMEYCGKTTPCHGDDIEAFQAKKILESTKTQTLQKATQSMTKTQVQQSVQQTPPVQAQGSSQWQPESKTVPTEYKSALNTAESYANEMWMSKRRLYDQLVSEYGERFTAGAAQYAIDNVKADWSANALATAKNYQNTMNMSPARIHDQLTSEYGEKFTQAEADYAIQHLND